METNFKRWENMSKQERLKFSTAEKMKELFDKLGLQEIIQQHCTHFDIKDPMIIRTLNYDVPYLVDTSETKNIRNSLYKAFYLLIEDDEEWQKFPEILHSIHMTRSYYTFTHNVEGRGFGSTIYRVVPFDGAKFGVSPYLIGNQFMRKGLWGEKVGQVEWFTRSLQDDMYKCGVLKGKNQIIYSDHWRSEPENMIQDPDVVVDLVNKLEEKMLSTNIQFELYQKGFSKRLVEQYGLLNLIRKYANPEDNGFTQCDYQDIKDNKIPEEYNLWTQQNCLLVRL